ncbi:unnamed protein product, partial [Adineta steineri]
LVLHTYVCRLFPTLKNYCLTFNVFKSVPPSTDEHELKNQLISTRIFIVLLILSLTILLLYTSLANITKTINVPTPTLTKYEQLYSKYSQTLTCPCKQISINYEKFLSIEYTFHQVCTSFFITDDWISYIGMSYEATFANINFQWTSPNAFQALGAFCELVESTINNSLIQFNSSQYITASVASSELFQLQARSFVKQFMSSTTNTFVLSLNTIRNSTHGDGLLSGLLTNYKITVGTSVSNEPIVLGTPVGYSKCGCISSSRCIEQSSFLNSLSNMDSFDVPGFYTGCYVIEALLQSTLQCFYHQTCIDDLQIYLSPPVPMDVTALDSLLPSQYSENSTIEYLLNNLMIEEWNSTQLYDQYYNECQPIECTYTTETRNSVIYIITTIFGIIGGLITVLRCVVPQVVKFVRKKKDLIQPRIENVTMTVNIATPTLTKYEQLYSKYPQTLICPCKNISTNYEKFLSIEYTFHQVCTSFFITDDWISYIAIGTTGYLVTGDFRVTGPYQFETLRAFCELINRCYTTEALLRSTLECFYNQTCIDQLQIYLLPPVLKNVTALDSSLPSQYSEDSTIEYLLNNLMIEEWNSIQMYDRYYDECQPIECTYTINTRNNILYVMTTLIGIIGGLTRVSKILVPILVKIIVYCFRKWRNTVVPQISIIQT